MGANGAAGCYSSHGMQAIGVQRHVKVRKGVAGQLHQVFGLLRLRFHPVLELHCAREIPRCPRRETPNGLSQKGDGGPASWCRHALDEQALTARERLRGVVFVLVDSSSRFLVFVVLVVSPLSRSSSPSCSSSSLFSPSWPSSSCSRRRLPCAVVVVRVSSWSSRPTLQSSGICRLRPRGRVLIGCGAWGSSMAGPKFDEPDVGQKTAAQG